MSLNHADVGGSGTGRLIAVLPARIRARWDRLAFQQLCEASCQLRDALDRAEQEISFLRGAEQQADLYQALYQETADQLAEVGAVPRAQPGITMAGEILVVRS